MTVVGIVAYLFIGLYFVGYLVTLDKKTDGWLLVVTALLWPAVVALGAGATRAKAAEKERKEAA